MPDIRKSTFLGDARSQILALSDALAAEHGPGIAAAFDDVARTRGLAQIARDADVEIEALCAAFSDPHRPDIRLLKNVLAALTRAQPVLKNKGERGRSIINAGTDTQSAPVYRAE